MACLGCVKRPSRRGAWIPCCAVESVSVFPDVFQRRSGSNPTAPRHASTNDRAANQAIEKRTRTGSSGVQNCRSLAAVFRREYLAGRIAPDTLIKYGHAFVDYVRKTFNIPNCRYYFSMKLMTNTNYKTRVILNQCRHKHTSISSTQII